MVARDVPPMPLILLAVRQKDAIAKFLGPETAPTQSFIGRTAPERVVAQGVWATQAQRMRQRYFGRGASAAGRACSVFARLSARFCLSVLSDFLLIAWRGDLSDIADPFVWGLAGPVPRAYTSRLRLGFTSRVRRHAGCSVDAEPFRSQWVILGRDTGRT